MSSPRGPIRWQLHNRHGRMCLWCVNLNLELGEAGLISQNDEGDWDLGQDTTAECRKGHLPTIGNGPFPDYKINVSRNPLLFLGLMSEEARQCPDYSWGDGNA